MLDFSEHPRARQTVDNDQRLPLPPRPFPPRRRPPRSQTLALVHKVRHFIRMFAFVLRCVGSAFAESQGCLVMITLSDAHPGSYEPGGEEDG